MPAHAFGARRYRWPRLWTRPGENIDEGFFEHRPLRLGGTAAAVDLNELADHSCLVLLGEPGLGKSHAIRDAVEHLSGAGGAVHLVDLGAYDDGEALISAIVDSVTWRRWRSAENYLCLVILANV